MEEQTSKRTSAAGSEKGLRAAVVGVAVPAVAVAVALAAVVQVYSNKCAISFGTCGRRMVNTRY